MVRQVKLGLILTFCLALCATFGWTRTEAQNTPAEKAFKNIQALKGVPASQITPIMDHFNKALGVNCDYCHTMTALEKGDKPAHKMTVQMINMVRDLQGRYKISVDCMGCHQGKAKPAISASLNLGGGGAVVAANNPPPGNQQGRNQQQQTPPPQPETPPAQTEAAPPDKVVFKANTPLGNVPFDHTQHMGVGDCATCHHTGDNVKCSTCHQKAASAMTKVRMFDAVHSRTSERACSGCHIKSNAGPKNCAECHKRGS